MSAVRAKWEYTAQGAGAGRRSPGPSWRGACFHGGWAAGYSGLCGGACVSALPDSSQHLPLPTRPPLRRYFSAPESLAGNKKLPGVTLTEEIMLWVPGRRGQDRCAWKGWEGAWRGSPPLGRGRDGPDGPTLLGARGLLGDAPGLAGPGTRLQAWERGGRMTRPTGSTGPTGNGTVTLRGNHSDLLKSQDICRPPEKGGIMTGNRYLTQGRSRVRFKVM